MGSPLPPDLAAAGPYGMLASSGPQGPWIMRGGGAQPPSALIPLTDLGTGSEVLAVTPAVVAFTDSGSASDSMIAAIAIALTDSGAATDTISLLNQADHGTGTDTLTASIAVALTDSGTATEFLHVPPPSGFNLAGLALGPYIINAATPATASPYALASAISLPSSAWPPPGLFPSSHTYPGAETFPGAGAASATGGPPGSSGVSGYTAPYTAAGQSAAPRVIGGQQF